MGGKGSRKKLDGKVRFSVGSRVGSYTLVENVGEGGSGIVFLAKKDYSDIPRKVKIFKLDSIHSKIKGMRDRNGLVATVMRECDVLAEANHPNIARYYDHGTVGDTFYTVSEYVDGRSVEDALPLDAKQAVDIFAEMLKAVDYLHNFGKPSLLKGSVKKNVKDLLHPQPMYVLRDISLRNVILSRSGRFIKLIDLEMLARADDIVEHCPTRGPESTSAPELYLGDSASAQSDIYALGACFLYMLRGRVGGLEELNQRGRKEYNKGLDNLLHDCGAGKRHTLQEAHVELLKGCLAYRPEERFETVHRLQDELEPYAGRLDGGLQFAKLRVVGCDLAGNMRLSTGGWDDFDDD